MAYQTLYESSVAFGMRKALQTEQGKSDGGNRRRAGEEDRRPGAAGGGVAREVRGDREAREAERRAREETKHAEETAFLNRANKQLKQQLDKFLQEPPAAARSRGEMESKTARASIDVDARVRLGRYSQLYIHDSRRIRPFVTRGPFVSSLLCLTW